VQPNLERTRYEPAPFLHRREDGALFRRERFRRDFGDERTILSHDFPRQCSRRTKSCPQRSRYATVDAAERAT
jgi:hypothetical protein